MAMIRRLAASAALVTLAGALAAPQALAQSAEALKADASTAGDVLTYGMGYNNQRYSALKQINTSTVDKLTPIWSYSLNNRLSTSGHWPNPNKEET